MPAFRRPPALVTLATLAVLLGVVNVALPLPEPSGLQGLVSGNSQEVTPGATYTCGVGQTCGYFYQHTSSPGAISFTVQCEKGVNAVLVEHQFTCGSAPTMICTEPTYTLPGNDGPPFRGTDMTKMPARFEKTCRSTDNPWGTTCIGFNPKEETFIKCLQPIFTYTFGNTAACSTAADGSIACSVTEDSSGELRVGRSMNPSTARVASNTAISIVSDGTTAENTDYQLGLSLAFGEAEFSKIIPFVANNDSDAENEVLKLQLPPPTLATSWPLSWLLFVAQTITSVPAPPPPPLPAPATIRATVTIAERAPTGGARICCYPTKQQPRCSIENVARECIGGAHFADKPSFQEAEQALPDCETACANPYYCVNTNTYSGGNLHQVCKNTPLTIVADNCNGLQRMNSRIG